MALLNFLVPNSISRVSNIAYDHREKKVSFFLSVFISDNLIANVPYSVSRDTEFCEVIGLDYESVPPEMEVGQHIHISKSCQDPDLSEFKGTVVEKTDEGLRIKNPLTLKDISSGFYYKRNEADTTQWIQNTDPALSGWDLFFSIEHISQHNIVKQAYLYLLSRTEFAGVVSDE